MKHSVDSVIHVHPGMDWAVKLLRFDQEGGMRAISGELMHNKSRLSLDFAFALFGFFSLHFADQK